MQHLTLNWSIKRHDLPKELVWHLYNPIFSWILLEFMNLRVQLGEIFHPHTKFQIVWILNLITGFHLWKFAEQQQMWPHLYYTPFFTLLPHYTGIAVWLLRCYEWFLAHWWLLGGSGSFLGCWPPPIFIVWYGFGSSFTVSPWKRNGTPVLIKPAWIEVTFMSVA